MKIVSVWIMMIAVLCSANGGMSLELQHVYTACDKGEATACFELGELYREGLGVDANLTKAKAYYQKACDKGFEKACTKMNK